MQQQQARNNTKATRILSQGMPDQTFHQAPGAMAALGWIGLIAGIGANLWQMYTTISAVYCRALLCAFPEVTCGFWHGCAYGA
jgi:hypothetical protein